MQGRPKIEDDQMARVWNGLWRPYGDTRVRRLRGGARRADKSNVDSGELRIQSTRLKYKEGGTGKITDETRIRRKSG